ncbi:MAG: SIS domain-containing protein [Flavobacteriales bacterium]|nr:SIS domain-containing protein [Flavobacteriales bacterium]
MITHEDSLKDFSSQIKFSIENYSGHGLLADDLDVILLGGLGGSGIAAAIAKNWFFTKANRPIETVNDYHLPAYVSSKSLVVLNSYSGNTEETLSLYKEAKEKGCKIIVLSSGGRITDLAEQDGIKTYPLMAGFQPRQSIGLGLTFMFLILGELFGMDLTSELTEVGEKLDQNQDRLIDSAAKISTFVSSSVQNKYVIITDREMHAVGVRFANQIQENAKLEAFVHVVPECNHNVIESYIDRLNSNFFLIYTEENVRIGSRFEFLTGHLEMENNKVFPMLVPEYSIYSIYNIIYRLDWVSVMIANQIHADLMHVPTITSLKEYLESIEEIEDFTEEDEG